MDPAGNRINPPHHWSFRSAKQPTTAYPRSIFLDETPSVDHVLRREPVELGLEVPGRRGGEVLGVRFYKGLANRRSTRASLWESRREPPRHGDLRCETAAGWQEVRFDPAVRMRAIRRTFVSYNSPDGVYGYNHDFFGSGRGQRRYCMRCPIGGRRPNVSSPTGVDLFPRETVPVDQLLGRCPVRPGHAIAVGSP